MLNGKKILIGVTGSIAAYKISFLTRLLVKEGAHVKIILTPAAKEFVTPLTLGTLSKNEVLTSYTKSEDTGEWNNHVELGLWADLLLIAPATANTIAKAANGICDNLLMAVYQSARCPVAFAPAMDLDMYQHQSNIDNRQRLHSFDNLIIDAEDGELASGLSGQGRMAEPEHIFQFLENHFASNKPLLGKKILITAGPTYEKIDPVRFIGNHSSGKMGVAIANMAAEMGAEVELVLGPTSLNHIINDAVKVVNVHSAEEMYKAALVNYDTKDIAILSAAVADYKPKIVFDEKIKKENLATDPVIELEKTKDILAELGAQKKHQFLVGFALETNNEVENAKQKISRKNLDLIVLNSLRDKGAGFAVDTNQITIIDNNNNLTRFELKNKSEVAIDILTTITEKINA